MGGTRRKNKSKGQTRGSINAPWFVKNNARQKKRRKIAKQSRRRNRGN